MLARREMDEPALEEREESEPHVDEVKQEEDLSKFGEGFVSEDHIRLFPWKEAKAPIQAVIRLNLREVLSELIVSLEVILVQNSAIANTGYLDYPRAEVPWTKLAEMLSQARLTLVRWPYDCRMSFDPTQTTKKTFSSLQSKEKEMLAEVLELDSAHALRAKHWDNSMYL